MKQLFLLTLMLVFLAGLLSAQPAQESNPRASMQELSAAIQTELENHGDRVLGTDIYRWSTRLRRITDCRAEFSIRVTDRLGSTTVHNDDVHFSLGAIEPTNIDRQKNWLALSCAGRQKCFLFNSTCSKKTKDGIVIDCATASQKREDSLSLNLDGDAAAALRLERAFHEAVDLCRTPKTVIF
jgi:hypothetical protein